MQLAKLGFEHVDAVLKLAAIDPCWNAIGELQAAQGRFRLLVAPSGAL